MKFFASLLGCTLMAVCGCLPSTTHAQEATASPPANSTPAPPDWKRLLRSEGFDSDRPRLLWAPGEVAAVNLHLSNMATVPYAGPCSVELTDDLEKPLRTWAAALAVPAQGHSATALQIDTKGLRQGIYLLKCATPDGAVSSRALLTVAGLDPLPKAKDGEFLYGMDIAAQYTDTLRLDWVDWCGIDLVRGYGRNVAGKDEDLEEIARAIAAMEKRGLRGSMMLYPIMPFDPDPQKFDAIIARKVDFVGRLAARFKGVIKFYEIGNEPDQHFFFPGGGENYVKFYVALRDAIKASDPAAVVSNGGLCFHDNYGEKTGHDIVRLMPADKIDAWAYHAHGPGSGAERNVYDKLAQATAAAGQGDKPFFDTESGFECTEPVGYRVQARTVVQKNIFAQSTGRVKMFAWFGLHPNWIFGLLETPNQARPGALAYRVLVQRTRGLKARGPLDLQGAPGEGYWLADNQGNTTVVLWSNGAEFTRRVVLGSGATGAVFYDLFGNPSPASLDAEGRVQAEIGADPLYLSARLAPGNVVTVLPPAVDVRRELRVAPGTTSALKLVVHNPASAAMDAQLSITPQGDVPVEPTALRVSVAPGGSLPVSVPLTIKNVAPDWWPRGWRVFAPVEAGFDLSTVTQMPASLVTGATKLAPFFAAPVDGKIDLKALTGGSAERRQAICFAEVNLPADQDAEIGASADFWMEWWVNGKNVYSTLAKGNGSLQSVLSHTFKVHLNKGKNLLAVRVLSGQGGWALISGGPETVAAARRHREGKSDAASVTLREGDRILSRELIKVQLLPPLIADDDRDPTQQRPPDASFGEVTNLHTKNPDSSRWFKGPADLSGNVWFGKHEDGSLHVTALVRDDIATEGDGIEIKLAAGPDYQRREEFTRGTPEISSKRDNAGAITRYEAVIPRAKLPVASGELFAVQVKVLDDDWGELKQTASLSPSAEPADWPLIWMEAPEVPGKAAGETTR